MIRINKNKCIQDIFDKYDSKSKFRNKFRFIIVHKGIDIVLDRPLGRQVPLENLSDAKIVELCKYMNINITMTKH